MPTARLVIEEYLEGLWALGWNHPDERVTDLPPLMCKSHRLLPEDKEWENLQNQHAYEKTYAEFSQKVQEAFARLAQPDERLEVNANPCDTYWNGNESTEVDGTLQEAIDEVGLPTRADVDSWSKIIEEKH